MGYSAYFIVFEFSYIEIVFAVMHLLDPFGQIVKRPDDIPPNRPETKKTHPDNDDR